MVEKVSQESNQTTVIKERIAVLVGHDEALAVTGNRIGHNDVFQVGRYVNDLNFEAEATSKLSKAEIIDSNERSKKNGGHLDVA